MPRLPFLLVLLLSTTTSAIAQDWHRVLVPIYFEGEVPGAFGSRWVVELTGYNGFFTHQRVTGHPSNGCLPSQCADFITPGDFFVPYLGGGATNVGRFVYIRSTYSGIDDPESVRFSLVTRDVSREAEGFGTQIPVVREDDTFSGKIAFPSVPMGARYRQKLRVYDFDGERGGEVVVKIYRHGSTDFDAFDLITQRTLSFTSGEAATYPSSPGFAQIDLDSIPELAGQDRVSVLVRPANEGHYWAFISVTNNDTQQVTTLAP